ncbi:sulfite exporter TauE/SafE family protein [Actinokineospora sp.]|uniref:sulfite exporter TauE/SafE family protein n=1 Tax=Actinokineospora sp. TaxID=1872133 RepID=UPI004037E4ED
MTVWEAIGVVLAGVFAGGINTVVGSGTLVTFPVLLAVGYPPVVANVSNTLGLVPGSVTGAIGYRRELVGQRARLLRLGAASVTGGAVGAVLLLVLPPGAFETIVPVLIVLALVLVVAQPWLSRKLDERQAERHLHGGLALFSGVFVTGVYGGYFGAAQGVLLLALMGILMDETLQRINAVKNVLAAVVNLASGIIFVFVAEVAWLAVALIAGGAIVGGLLGAKVGRKLSPAVLRGVIVVVGVAAIVQLLAR